MWKFQRGWSTVTSESPQAKRRSTREHWLAFGLLPLRAVGGLSRRVAVGGRCALSGLATPRKQSRLISRQTSCTIQRSLPL